MEIGTRYCGRRQVLRRSAPPERGPGPAMNPPLRLRIRAGGPGVVVVHLTGEIDLTTASMLETILQTLPVPPPPPGLLVVLGLSGLDFCDVAGLNAMLRSARVLAERGARLALAAPPWSFRKLLRAACLDGYFDVVPAERGHIALRGAGDVPTLKCAAGEPRARGGRHPGLRCSRPAPWPAA